MVAPPGELKMPQKRYHFPDLKLCCRSLAEHIVEIALQCVAEKGKFTFVVAGGETPRPLYQFLAATPFVEQMPWQQTHLFWGDERCVPADHPDSNYRMVTEELRIESLPAKPTLHQMPGEVSPSVGAATSENELRRFFCDKNSNHSIFSPPVFDLVLLGLGSDGHTASLFPNAKVLAEKTGWVASTPPGILAPQVDRLTLTLPVFNNATEVVFLAAGKNKIGIIDRILADRLSSLDYPAALINPTGKLLWYTADA